MKKHGDKKAPIVVIAVGSNLGDSQRIVLNVMDRLHEFSTLPVRRSSLWRTTPVDCPTGSASFINSVVILSPLSGETPESLLLKLQALEKEFGRKEKNVMNEPRPLDLDIILFGGEMRKTPELTLPHPRAHERRFVLEPLNEIATDLVLPGQSKSVKQLLDALLPDAGMVRVR